MSRFALRAALLVATAATVGCDRLTKHLASDALAGEPGRSFLGGMVQLEYAENPGAFLGLGAYVFWDARQATEEEGAGPEIAL